jgi:hypothetical protein
MIFMKNNISLIAILFVSTFLSINTIFASSNATSTLNNSYISQTTPYECNGTNVNPCTVPIGIGAYGTTNTSAGVQYNNYSTDGLRGTANIYSLYGVSDYRASSGGLKFFPGAVYTNLQFNTAISTINATGGTGVYIMQTVAVFNQTGNVSTIRFSNQYPETAASNNSQPFQYAGPITVNLSITVSQTGNILVMHSTSYVCSIPCVPDKSFSFSGTQKTNVPGLKRAYLGAHQGGSSGEELVFSGAPGSISNYSSMNATLSIFYQNGNRWYQVPYTYNYGTITAESAYNLQAVPYSKGMHVTQGGENPSVVVYGVSSAPKTNLTMTPTSTIQVIQENTQPNIFQQIWNAIVNFFSHL